MAFSSKAVVVANGGVHPFSLHSLPCSLPLSCRALALPQTSSPPLTQQVQLLSVGRSCQFSMNIVSALPDDLRRHCLGQLRSPYVLCQLASVSQGVRAFANDDRLWHALCDDYWRHANLGALCATHRECFRSANGWACLRALPRTTLDISGSAGGGTRAARRHHVTKAAPSPIRAFDSVGPVVVTARLAPLSSSHGVGGGGSGMPTAHRSDGQPSLAAEITMRNFAGGVGRCSLQRTLALLPPLEESAWAPVEVADVKLVPGSCGDGVGSDSHHATSSPRAVALLGRGSHSDAVSRLAVVVARDWAAEESDEAAHHNEGGGVAQGIGDIELQGWVKLPQHETFRRMEWAGGHHIALLRTSPTPAVSLLDLSSEALISSGGGSGGGHGGSGAAGLHAVTTTGVEGSVSICEELSARSMCCHPAAPYEVTLALRNGSRSMLVHLDPRLPGWSALGAETHHSHILRVRSAGPNSVLTSHTRSKEIHLWDIRRFGCSAIGLDGSHLPAASTQYPTQARTAPVGSYKCAGNAPDMHCDAGIIAAVSGGAPGTTYGAKLHIFSDAPRRLAVDATLSEVVIDDGHRLSCPQGIRLDGRTLTMVADKQRLLRCWVPGREGI